MNEVVDLWPDFKIEKVRSPKTILKEQADLLGKKTSNILLGEVDFIPSKSGGEDFIFFEFKIKAPNLGGYTYSLFNGKYNSILMYPASIGVTTIGNESSFMDAIRDILKKPSIIRVINSLYSQSVEDSE